MTQARVKLEDDFVPRAGMRNGHLQTILPAFMPRRNALPPAEERLFQVEEGVQVLCHCHWQPERQDRLTEIIVHGLEGSAESQYVIGNGSKAWEAGWNVVRFNVRNCGGTQGLGATLYHSGLSGDVRAIVETLIRSDNLQRIALVGYSMGGNMVLKATGEWGNTTPAQLKAVAAVSPGVDLDASATLLHHWKNRVYEQHFVRSLKKNMRLKSKLFPGRYDLARLRGLNSIRDFDEHVTAFYWGFEGASDYYRRASASPLLGKIAVPTLIIHALDDPFIRITDQTRSNIEGNENIRFIETQHGGHCGFVGRASKGGDDGRWAERKILEFFQSIA